MPYKCEGIDGNDGCANCIKGIYGKFACKDNVNSECPLNMGLSYPAHIELCDECCFVPKEEVNDMIMTEEEMDEQLEKYESESKCGGNCDDCYHVSCQDNISHQNNKHDKDKDLITVQLRREQIENIVEFIDFNLIPFIKDEDNEVDNIMYLHSMSTLYVALKEALGENP